MVGLLVAVAVVVAVLALRPSADAVASCTAPETPIEDEVETFAYRELDRVDPELTSLDIYATPNAQDCPVLVWVHGGSWQTGDKSSRLTRFKAQHFADQGWIFVSVNYRLASEDNDVRWPDFGDDVAASVAWLVDNVEDVGGDPDQISLIGHSSGAHLVSIVGTNEDLLERQGLSRESIRCVVSLDSVTQDLTDQPPWEVDIIELSFPDVESQIDGSPTLQAAQPSNVVPPDFLIVTRGRQERISSSERLSAELIAAGGTSVVADLSPYDHSQVSSELGVEGEEMVTPAVDGFLSGCVNPPS